jgi:hypothetical protein
MRQTCVGYSSLKRLNCLALAAAAAFVLAIPHVSHADDGQAPEHDFLLGKPIGWFAVRGSWLVPAANGDLFKFVNDQLTIDKGDFRTAGITGEFGFALAPRVDAVVGIESGRQTVNSEYRRFIDNTGLPITQSTSIVQTDISGSVRLALLNPGRSVSQFAFVPRAVTPYVGGGGGFFYYGLTQKGDFVDFATFRVFPDVFKSNGWTPSAHVLAGADVRWWRSLFVTIEGRYVWANGDLDSDFIGFDGIKLNGFRLSSGISVFFK